jgi:hypothetical protein
MQKGKMGQNRAVMTISAAIEWGGSPTPVPPPSKKRWGAFQWPDFEKSERKGEVNKTQRAQGPPREGPPGGSGPQIRSRKYQSFR